LFRTKEGLKVNADLNGAANMLRKQVASNLDLDLSRVGRRTLTSVSRIKLWCKPTGSVRKNSLVTN
jgi:putative transposase